MGLKGLKPKHNEQFLICLLSLFQEQQQRVNNYAKERKKNLDQRPPKNQQTSDQDKVVLVESSNSAN